MNRTGCHDVATIGTQIEVVLLTIDPSFLAVADVLVTGWSAIDTVNTGLLKIGNCGCFLITRELLRKVLRGTNN